VFSDNLVLAKFTCVEILLTFGRQWDRMLNIFSIEKPLPSQDSIRYACEIARNYML